MSLTQLYFEDLKIGDQLPESSHETSRVQLFRYSAATWNAHRIHYDKDYAALEGYPDVLVHSHLHGAFLTRLCVEAAGPAGHVDVIELSIRKYATPGDRLVCRGEVVGKAEGDADYGVVHLAIEEIRESDGAVCAPGSATIRVPHRDAREVQR